MTKSIAPEEVCRLEILSSFITNGYYVSITPDASHGSLIGIVHKHGKTIVKQTITLNHVDNVGQRDELLASLVGLVRRINN